MDELISVGPLKLSVQLPEGVRGRTVRMLVAGRKSSASFHDGRVHFAVNSLLDHEELVIG